MTRVDGGPARVQVDLPQSWRPLAVAPDGDRRAQRSLVDDWVAEVGPPRPVCPTATSAAVRALVRQSRQAARDGVAFAAVLLGLVEGQLAVSGALTVLFRPLPAATDPRVAAEGVLRVLRDDAGDTRRPARRIELVGLGGDGGRPAVVLREQQPADGRLVALTQVLWLVPGSSRLATLTVATGNGALAAAFTEVALGAATSLQVHRAGPQVARA